MNDRDREIVAARIAEDFPTLWSKLSESTREFTVNAAMHLTEGMQNKCIPGYMRDGIWRYVLGGVQPGGFLAAVFSNDLEEAFSRGDEINQERMHAYVRLLFNNVPAGCHRSAERYNDWIACEGLMGIYAEQVQRAVAKA
jgi:hypothetical protein